MSEVVLFYTQYGIVVGALVPTLQEKDSWTVENPVSLNYNQKGECQFTDMFFGVAEDSPSKERVEIKKNEVRFGKYFPLQPDLVNAYNDIFQKLILPSSSLVL